MRKLIIGLVAVGFVVLLFVIYALLMDTEPIKVSNIPEADSLKMQPSNRMTQQTGDTGIRVLEEAQYVILDDKTNEISRVFGFKELLSPAMDTSHRRVKEPYMIFYDPDYECRIDADTGIFQMESSGAGPTPKDAQLSGNVTIHVIPKPGSGREELLVEMDDLVFSSERSEFATDRQVHIKSNQLDMKGTGLVVLFDPDNGRVDYLRIRDLEKMRMQDLTGSGSSAKSKDKTTEPKTKTASVSSEPKPKISGVSDKESATAQSRPQQELRYYQCLLDDNVKIQYGNEIIVSGAEQINIQNILLDDNVGNIESPEHSNQIKKDPVNVAEGANKKSADHQPSVEKKQAASGTVSSTEIIVTCDGGLILKPIPEGDENLEPASLSRYMNEKMPMILETAVINPSIRPHNCTVSQVNFVGEQDSIGSNPVEVNSESASLESDSGLSDPPPAKFEARKIDYDLLTGSGLAHGPVRFTFYQPPDPNATSTEPWVPIIVTADDNTEFIADSSQTIKQVVFNGNVMTTRQTEMPDFVQFDKIHSEKLTVDLDEVEGGSVGLNRLSVTEGKVYIDSQRTSGDQQLSQIKLYCTKISYDEINDVILAEGPGIIEMKKNENSQTASSGSNNPMDRPCVAMLDGFATIHWDIGNQSIIVDGPQDQLSLAYVPLIEGKPEKFIYVNAMRFDLNFDTDSTRKLIIKRMFTDKPIDYKELDSNKKELHHIAGGRLDYDASDEGGWVKISGTPEMPCYVDGWRTSEALVNPVTGEIDTSISTTPGILKRR